MKLIKKIIILNIIPFSIFAQQDYTFNKSIINPAYIAIDDYKTVNISYESRYIDLINSPKTKTLHYKSPFRRNTYIGLSVVNNVIHVLKETGLAFDFTYKLKLSNYTNLYLGLKTGVDFYVIDLINLGAPKYDPLFTENESYSDLRFGLGAYLHNDRYYISISMPNILKNNKYKVNTNSLNSFIDNLYYYIGGGYISKLNNNLDITTSFMMKNVEGIDPFYNISVVGSFKNQIKLGTNYVLENYSSYYFSYYIMPNLELSFAYKTEVSSVKVKGFNNSISFNLKYLWK
ncbi:MAG: PorP/SprF family type IX secretion system membrane protein [Flavobacteriaceae bacterium]|nr:PorP/SprF family type IX secretion system membrane protein [Flavobacteriaceae bacterium]